MVVVVSVLTVAIVYTALALVPVAQRASYQIDSVVTGPTLRGCGETLFGISGWNFPAGKLIHLSWTTDPAIVVFVNMSSVLTASFGPTFFSEEGSSGATSFTANGGGYEVNVTNCQTLQTNATLSAYYNYNAPLL